MTTQEKKPQAEESKHDACVLKGKWFITLYGAPGEVKEEISGYNVITTNGKEMFAQMLASCATGGTNTFRYIAIGSDATAEAASNTALGSELARAAGTASYASGAIYQVTATFASGTGTGSVYEYGLLNSTTAGTMLSRDTETLITKGANDTLTVTCQITLA